MFYLNQLLHDRVWTNQIWHIDLLFGLHINKFLYKKKIQYDIQKIQKKTTSVNALIRIMFHICKSILKRLIMWTASALKYIHRFQKALLCAYHSVILHVIVENKVTTCGYISVSIRSLSMQKHSLISMGRHSRNKPSAY